MTMLQVQNASKNFGSLVAVQNVSLLVQPGELRAIIGPNGAGKTTFFNLISGYLAPSAGTIVFDGQDVTRVPAHRRVGLGMARTFQVTEIFPELTVRETLGMFSSFYQRHADAFWVLRIYHQARTPIAR